MTSNSARLDRYKLQSTLTNNSVIHRTIQSDLGNAIRRIEVLTKWAYGRKLGAGAFGEVFLQRERISGRLRAVKAITRNKVRLHEMDALSDLQDVCMTLQMWDESGADRNRALTSSSPSWAGTGTRAQCISR